MPPVTANAPTTLPLPTSYLPAVPPRFISRRGRVRRVELALASAALGREVRITALLPPGYRLNLLARYPVLLVNDGQDFGALDLERRLGLAYRDGAVAPRIVVGLHADHDRMREYGTSGAPDYAGRGDRADAYRRFVIREALPFLRARFRLRKTREHVAVCGFSLGALSAFDVAWHHPDLIGHVGCFSGSFWWRSAPFDPRRPDADRIAVERVRAAARPADLRYHFAVGTAEETSDRNANGIIDAIDDTLDLIGALRARGVAQEAISYHVVDGGRHDQATWGPALIDWLRRAR